MRLLCASPSKPIPAHRARKTDCFLLFYLSSSFISVEESHVQDLGMIEINTVDWDVKPLFSIFGSFMHHSDNGVLQSSFSFIFP